MDIFWNYTNYDPLTRLHFIGARPKILGVGFKSLQRTGLRSTRYQCTEASDQGKKCKNGVGLWPTRSKFSKGFGVSSAWGLAECTWPIKY